MNDSARAPDSKPATDPVRTIFDLYAARRYDDLSAHLLSHLDKLARREIFDPDRATLCRHMDWLYAFLSVFVRPDYAPGRRYLTRFINHNATISNLVAVSSLGTTDDYLRLFGDNPRQIGKFLALCSARNTARLDYDLLFQRAPMLSNLWYTAYFDSFQASMGDPVAWRNLQQHLRQASRPAFVRRLVAFPRANSVFYACSYVDGEHDRALKGRINAVMQRSPRIAGIEVTNRPDPRHVAVVSMFWRSNHSVYRNFSRFVAALAERFRLTLIRRAPPDGRDADHEDVFERIIDFDFKDPSSVTGNDFGAVFFADVGMSLDSMLLANLRLAPVQIAGVGHSVSGFGNLVDYFISGAETEPATSPERHYSERLVLIPGLGVVHNVPRYAPTGATRDAGPLLINCSWTAQKINHSLLEVLARIVAGARRDIMFQFFPGHALRRHAGYLSFVRRLRSMLGETRVEVSPPLPYEGYMRAIEQCDFAIDAFHYGGCNTVADCLYLGKPMVAWEGERWNNRIGSAMLKRAGLDDLVATNADEYVAKVLQLVNDDEARLNATRRVVEADLDATVFSTADAPWFAQAVDYLVGNHATLSRERDRAPIVISERV